LYSIRISIPDELIVELRDWLLNKGYGTYPISAEWESSESVPHAAARIHTIPEPWKSLYPETLMIPNERAARQE
jgi:hypothetical protein